MTQTAKLPKHLHLDVDQHLVVRKPALNKQRTPWLPPSRRMKEKIAFLQLYVVVHVPFAKCSLENPRLPSHNHM